MKRTFLALLMLVLIGTTLTACGSSKKSSNASSTSGAATNFQAAFQAYRTCMSQNGVNLPDNQFQGRRGNNGGQPPSGGSQADSGNGGHQRFNGGTPPSTTLPAGVTQAQYQKAQQACQSKLPQRSGGFNRSGASASQFAAYLSCLKDHGVNVDTTAGPQALANIDRTTDAFKAAQTACQPLEPQRSMSSTTSTTAA